MFWSPVAVDAVVGGQAVDQVGAIILLAPVLVVAKGTRMVRMVSGQPLTPPGCFTKQCIFRRFEGVAAAAQVVSPAHSAGVQEVTKLQVAVLVAVYSLFLVPISMYRAALQPLEAEVAPVGPSRAEMALAVQST